jgi:hypothetical protein
LPHKPVRCAALRTPAKLLNPTASTRSAALRTLPLSATAVLGRRWEREVNPLFARVGALSESTSPAGMVVAAVACLAVTAPSPSRPSPSPPRPGHEGVLVVGVGVAVLMVVSHPRRAFKVLPPPPPLPPLPPPAALLPSPPLPLLLLPIPGGPLPRPLPPPLVDAPTKPMLDGPAGARIVALATAAARPFAPNPGGGAGGLVLPFLALVSPSDGYPTVDGFALPRPTMLLGGRPPPPPNSGKSAILY